MRKEYLEELENLKLKIVSLPILTTGIFIREA